MRTFPLKVHCKVIKFLLVSWSWYKANELCHVNIDHCTTSNKVGDFVGTMMKIILL